MENKNVFLAVILCMGIYLGWYNYYAKHYATPQTAAQSTAPAQQGQPAGAPVATPSTSLQASSEKAEAQQKIAAQKVETVTLAKGDFSATLSSLGGLVQNIDLKTYKNTRVEHMKQLVGGHDELVFSSPSADWAYLSKVNYVTSRSKDAGGNDQVVFTYEDANVSIKRIYSIHAEQFSVDQNLIANFKKTVPNYVMFSIGADKTKEKLENEHRSVLFTKVGGQTKFNLEDITDLKDDLGEGKWMGISSRYFLNALVDRGSALKPQFQVRGATEGKVEASLMYRVSSASFEAPLRLYFGPKELSVLKEVGSNLDLAVDFGWFTIIAYPLLTALKWFNLYVHNFGIAIILLTVLVKILLYPLTYKSVKSMKEMQRIQPQIQKIREKHKDDKEKLNHEMMNLMKTNGYNPMSGCLPMFVQMPIFIALYNVLYGAYDLYGQPFFGWIQDLSAKDPLFITPGILVLLMYIQQKMTPNTSADEAQRKMMLMMPVMFGFMMLWLPSGLTLYMVVNSFTSIVQQVMITRMMDKAAATPQVV